MSTSETTPQVIDAEALEYIQTVFDSHKLKGLSVAVVHGAAAPEFVTLGIRNEDEEHMEADTLVTIASCSKAFVSAACGILFDDYAQGRRPLPAGLSRVDWDTPIASLLPPGEWQLHEDYGAESDRICLRDLLSHRTGLHSHLLAYGNPGDMPADVVHRLRHLRPASHARERYRYCNPMIIAAVHVLNTLTGSYVDFVRERIFTPLGMGAHFRPADALASGRWAHGFSAAGRALPRYYDEEHYLLEAGTGGVTASAEDMAKWVKMFLNDGFAESGERVLPSEALESVTTPQIISSFAPGDLRAYCLAWFRQTYKGHDVVQHSGGNNDTSTVMMFAPRDQVGVVVLVNQSWKNRAVDALGWALLRKACGLALEDPPAPSAGPTLKPAPANSFKREAPTAAYDFSGTYHNAGYGAPLELYSATSTGAGAARVLSAFRAVHGPDAVRPGEYYAAWERAWVSHVRLVPDAHSDSGTRFRLVGNVLYTEGHGRDRTPFALHAEPEDLSAVEFEVGEGGRAAGFALSGMDGDEKTVRERRGGGLKETADVWFDRV